MQYDIGLQIVLILVWISCE